MRILLQWLVAAFVLAAWPARADFYIVANAANTQHELTRKETLDLFMGRSRAFPDGGFAQLYDLPREHPKRAVFYQSLTGLSAAQLNSYWSRLMFSGQTLPPQPMADEVAVIEAVKRNPAGLAWLTQEPSDKQLHVVMVLKEQP